MNLSFDNKLIFDEKKEKLSGKTQDEGFKLIWQWIKDGSINLSVYRYLIWKAMGEAHYPTLMHPKYDEDDYEAIMKTISEASSLFPPSKDELVWYRREQ